MLSSGNVTTLGLLTVSMGKGFLSGGLLPLPRVASATDPLFFQTLQSPSPPSWMASTPRKCGQATQ